MGSIRVFGIGNPTRGDDGVGWLVAGKLKERLPADVDVRLALGESLELIDAWSGADVVIVVDAMSSGAAPGTVHRFVAGRDALPVRTPASTSTHGLGLAEALEMARTIGREPPRLIVWGIEGKCFEIGAGLSPDVAAAVPTVVSGVLHDVSAAHAPKPTGPGH